MDELAPKEMYALQSQPSSMSLMLDIQSTWILSVKITKNVNQASESHLFNENGSDLFITGNAGRNDDFNRLDGKAGRER